MKNYLSDKWLSLKQQAINDESYEKFILKPWHESMTKEKIA